MASSKRKLQEMPRFIDVDGFLLPGIFTAEAFRSAINYKPRPDDLFLVSFPKCGITWVQNIVSNIYNKGQPFESALDFLSHTIFLELTGEEGAVKMKRPGAIKVHLPFRMTPYSPEAKYLFVARNPKDCCVSCFNHAKSFPGVECNFDDYFELFMQGQTGFGEYFDTLLSWYEHRNDPNVLFITYEDMNKNKEKWVLRIAEFMGEEYKEMLESDPELMSLVLYNSSFDFMKELHNNTFSSKELILNSPDIPKSLRDVLGREHIEKDSPKVSFIKKGTVGDWKNYFSADQNARLEKKFIEKTKGTDIPKLWEDYMGITKDSNC